MNHHDVHLKGNATHCKCHLSQITMCWYLQRNHSRVSERWCEILGVPSPFFPRILLSREPSETEGKRIRLFKRPMVEKNEKGINPCRNDFRHHPHRTLENAPQISGPPAARDSRRRPFRFRVLPGALLPAAGPSPGSRKEGTRMAERRGVHEPCLLTWSLHDPLKMG